MGSSTSALSVDSSACPAADAETPALGVWRAWLATPGGELPFELELQNSDGAWTARVRNGAERIAVPSTRLVRTADGRSTLELEFPHYDSRIEAEVSADGRHLAGTWRKRRGAAEWLELPFAATAGAARRFSEALLHAPAADVDRAQLARAFSAAVARARGRFAMRFEQSEDPAVATFEVADDGVASGTFLTTTGDYRYLAGQLDRAYAGDDGLVGCVDDGKDHHFLRLSCFDGAHAFLFVAEVEHDGTLRGGFWSGDRLCEAWAARPDAGAARPDAFALSKASNAAKLGALAFPQVFPLPATSPPITSESNAPYPLRRLDDPAFAAKVRIVQIFGSWCPNCHDACDELKELQRRYAERGLVILGLAFEITGDLARDAGQVQRYAARHGVTWPLLLAGPADKQRATETLGILDRVRAYPTTLFIDATGRVRSVYTGFSGPATGAEFARQRARFEKMIEELLSERR